ncbi:MAG: response regulator transcription factor [Dehalococcoidales bacterium]
MSKGEIKVFIFSEQPIFRQGIINALADNEDIQIIGQAGVSDKVLLTIEVLPPEVAIVDIDAPEASGLNLASRLKQLIPSVRVITLTSNTSDEQLFQSLSHQASAHLSKEVTGDTLANVVRRVASGDYPINESVGHRPQVAGKILKQFQRISGKKEAETLVAPLTNREVEILNYVAQGYANKQIAAEIGISEQTIKNHITSIMAKLNANARTQAVVIAVKKGLISLS